MEKLVIKLLTDTISKEELATLQIALQNSANKKEFEELIKANLYLDLNAATWQTDKALINVLNKIDEEQKPVKKLTPYWIKYAAASIIILLMTSIYFSNEHGLFSSPEPTIKVLAPIVAGSNKAILTLENGVEVPLEKGKNFTNKNLSSNGSDLVYDSSNTLPSDKKGHYNYLTIPRGGQFFLKLSDGTKVWLNSESKIKYPVTFLKNKIREVELVYGEAYFEVSPSTLHNGAKFKVNSSQQSIMVLGTQFNVKAYKNDNVISTSLVEGKVNVKNSSSEKNLKPGEASYLNLDSGDITVKKADIENAIAWKNGYFIFNNEPLEDMTTILSRWYNVVFIFENQKKKDIRFTGVLNRSDDIQSLLKKIQKTDEAVFDIQNNRIIIK